MEQDIRQAVETLTMNVRRALDAHLDEFTADLVRRAQETREAGRADFDRAVSEVKAEAEHAFAAKLEALRGELTQEMELRLEADRAELEAANADRSANERQGRMDALSRLVAAVRRLDDAGTLSGILEALAKGAAGETSRVAILLVEGHTLKTWGHFGFAADASPSDLPIDEVPVFAAAIGAGKTSLVSSPSGAPDPSVPAFMRLAPGHAGLVAPIAVAGEVVAVLYADDASKPVAPVGAPEWTEEIEWLVRYASVRLENVTSERAVEVLTRET